jgi:hypothetical protein
MRVSASYLEKVAKDWQRAFTEANGKVAPAVTWERGWFKIDGGQWRHRRATLEEMTKTLRKGFKHD